MKGDTTIYTLIDGKMVKINDPVSVHRDNFVIVCDFGDWSGFRMLDECVAQFPELEANGRPNRYYSVVERF